MALVCFYSCTNVLWNATKMEPARFLKNYSRNPKNMLKNHNYFKEYLMNSASCPDTLLFAYEFSIRCCTSINFTMNEQINFILQGFLVLIPYYLSADISPRSHRWPKLCWHCLSLTGMFDEFITHGMLKNTYSAHSFSLDKAISRCTFIQ